MMMRRASKGRSRRSRGQVLILVAVGILVILGALALCTDVAVFYFNWSQLRKEADAAALAGANYLPNNTSQATTTSAQYVQLNGQPGDSILQNAVGSLGFNGMANSSLTVQLSRTVPFYFGRVFGLVSDPVVVLATAAVEPVSGSQGWIPIAMPCTTSGGAQDCFKNTTGSSCTAPSNATTTSCMGVSETVLNPAGPFCYSGASNTSPVQVTLASSSIGPGNWEPLACTASGNNGSAGYQSALTGGCNDVLKAQGTATIDSKPGSDANATYAGLTSRINCSGSSCSNPDCPTPGNLNDPTQASRMVLIPLMDTSQFQGRTTAPVYGFLLGWIESISKGSGTVRVVVDVISGDSMWPGTPNPNGPNTGSFAPILIQ